MITSKDILKIEAFCCENEVAETYRGNNPYNKNQDGEWVYFDCYFDEQKIRTRFDLPKTVNFHEYDGRASGQESGFVDDLTNDAVMGIHPKYGKLKGKKKLG